MSNVPGYSPQPAQNFGHAQVIVPNDVTPLSTPAQSIWVGGFGNVTLIPLGQTTSVTFTAVPAGTLLPVAAGTVLATGTTAANMLALN